MNVKMIPITDQAAEGGVADPLRSFPNPSAAMLGEKRMRRKDRAIGAEEARRLLETAEYGVLSMASSDAVPYGIPLNFSFVMDCIYFHCAPEGKKIDLLSSNRKVTFCVVGRTEVMPEKFATKYESVIATGIAEELFEKDKKEGLISLLKKYSPDHMEEGVEYINRLFDKTKVFRICLESITGKARR
ncbi:MAG: pyridoxamine 5'-phosphate oxidase family protein [Thermodesulfobacteriota bacterium]